MDSNTFAITLAEADDDYFFTAAAVGSAGAITLLKTTVGTHGTAYKLTLHSAGNSSTRTWTIVGKGVGNATDITEVITAGNTAAVTTTNYFASVTSITASGAMTGDQKVGYAASPVLIAPTLIRSVNWISEATAGSIVINRNSATGAELLKIYTPAAGAGVTSFDSIDCGAIRVRGSAARTDFAIVTLTTVTKVTFICGG